MAHRIFTTLSVLTFVACSQSATAQMNWIIAPPMVMATPVVNKISAEQPIRRIQRRPNGQSDNIENSTSYPLLPYTAFNFVSSPTRTRANLDSMVDQHLGKNSPAALETKQFFASYDIFARPSQALAAQGLSRYNVADIYSAYWVVAWSVAHNSNSMPSKASAQAVALQSRRMLSSVPAYANMGDAEKQKIAEGILLQLTTVAFSMITAKRSGNPQEVQKVMQQVRQAAMSSGLDLDAMTLTEQGFVPVSAAVYRR